MFKETRYIQTSEIGDNKRLRVKDLIDIIQDLEGNHIDSLTMLKRASIEENFGILLNFRYIKVNYWPKYKDKLVLFTYPFETKAFLGYRNTLIKNEDNELLVECYCVGSFIQLDTLKPFRLTQELIDDLGDQPKHEMNYMGRKINLDIEKTLVSENMLIVRKNELDYYNHLNNAYYVEMAFNQLPLDYTFSEIICEYKLAFQFKEEIFIKTYQTQTGYLNMFYNKDNQLCAIIIFNK